MKTRILIIRTVILFLAFYSFSAQTLSANDSKGNKPQSSDFRITHPNGGEKFGIGYDKIITWEGCAAEDEITLEYSTDGGHDWMTITDNAKGFEHEWGDIPNSLSDSCLIKASVNDSTANGRGWILGLGTLNQVIYSPDGTKLASCGRGGIFIWDIANVDTMLSIRENTGNVYCIAFSPDGSRIASGGDDNTIKIWDANTGTEIVTLSGHTGIVFSVCFSPDGNSIASGSMDETIKIWDANTGAKIKTLGGFSGFVYSVSYSPDGSRIASGSGDNTIKIWDANTGAETRKLQGHKSGVRSVCYSPDGSRIVSGSWDETIKIWDSNTGAEIKTLSWYSGCVNSITYSPDGKHIASVNDDETITFTIWNTGTSDVSDSFFSISKTDAVEETVFNNNSSINPNPFSNSTTINYNLIAPTAVTINIYNARGEKIRTLDEGFQNPGQHSAIFEANELPIGMYYYTISIGNKIESGKMILAR